MCIELVKKKVKNMESKTKTCRKGHENPNYARFCKECGITFDVKSIMAVETTKNDLEGSLDIAENISTKLETFASMQNQLLEKTVTIEHRFKNKSY